jgi:hypothetical protein
MMRNHVTALAFAAAAMLAACGGGGADAGSPPFVDGAASAPTGGGSSSTPTGPAGGISNVSNSVPSQRFMSISVETYNLDWSFDGKTTDIQVFAADTAGNPIPDGSAIQFSTEGGQIVTSCVTSGIKAGTSAISGCSVKFNTQDYRPIDGYVTLIAWMIGEEAYKDLNANGKYDSGEPFIDSGRVFRDDDESGDYSASFDELVVGSTLTAQPGIGSAACALPAIADLPNVNEIPLSLQNSCDGVWGTTLIRRTVRLPVSDPRLLQVVQSTSPGGLNGVYVFSDTSFTVVRPLFEQPAAPLGTTVAVANAPTGCTVSITPTTVANAVTATFHAISGVGATCAGQSVTVSATFAGRAPATTTFVFP